MHTHVRSHALVRLMSICLVPSLLACPGGADETASGTDSATASGSTGGTSSTSSSTSSDSSSSTTTSDSSSGEFVTGSATADETGGGVAYRLLGVTFRDGDLAGNASLYDVDPATGAVAEERETGSDVLLGLTWAPDGRLLALNDSFGVVNGESAEGVLLSLDPATGATDVIGPLGLESVSEGDLDFNPADGGLYAVVSAAGASALYSVDPASGTASPIGELPAQDASAMAFTADGRLFVLDTTFMMPPGAAVLYEVDPATGDSLQSFDTGVALGNVAGMDFDPGTGLLYMADGDNDATGRLYTIDIATGTLTVVGETMVPGTFGGLAGLEFVPDEAASG